jgi:hypothetical protein
MSVTTILANLVVGFGEEAVKEACEKYLAGEVEAVKPQRRKYKPRGKSTWNVYVEEVLAEMRETDSEITNTMAMSEASRRRRLDNPALEVKYQENKAKREAKKAAKAAKQAARQVIQAVTKEEVEEVKSEEVKPEEKPRAKSPEKAAEKPTKSKASEAAQAASKVTLPKSQPASAAPSAAPSDTESTKKTRGRPKK